MYSFHPIIAAIDIRLIFWIIIGIVSFVSWLSKKLKENQEKAGMARPQKDDAIRNEIESFLQDVLGTKPEKKPRRQQANEDDFLEIVEEQPRRKQQGRKPQRKRKNTLQRKRKPRQRQNIEDRSVGQSASAFGTDLKEHVSEHLEQEHYEEDIGHDVDQSVSKHLGASSFSGEDIELISSSDQLRADVIEMFKNPADVRKAIVLNLILTPPTSLKKK